MLTLPFKKNGFISGSTNQEPVIRALRCCLDGVLPFTRVEVMRYEGGGVFFVSS